MRCPTPVLSACVMAAVGCGCGGDTTLDPCDIRKSSCQHDVFLAVQDVRGDTWDPWLDPPGMRVISAERYRQELAQHQLGLPDSLQSPDYQTAALQLLHMLDPDERPDAAAAFAAATVAAYYDSDKRRITIVDRGDATDHPHDVRTLAHELVHAAQARELGFSTFKQSIATSDAGFALSTVLEGEAKLYENLVDFKQNHASPAGYDWDAYHEHYIHSMREQVVRETSPFRAATWGLSYPLGSRYCTEAYLSAGPIGVRRAIQDRPLTSVSFMRLDALLEAQELELDAAGEGPSPSATTTGANVAAAMLELDASDDASDAPDLTDVADNHGTDSSATTPQRCVTATAPGGYRQVGIDSLGALALYAFATRIWVDDAEPQAWKQSLFLRADRLAVFVGEDAPERVAVAWSLGFDSVEHAQALQSALANSPLAADVHSAIHTDIVELRASTQALPDFAPDGASCVDGVK